MDWLNALIFLSLIAGNTTLWVAYVNRTHSLPLGCGTLHRLRRLHDIMIIVVPLLLIVLLGLTGPKLLLGGNWSDVSTISWVAISLCGFGFIGLLVAISRHWFLPPPSQLVSISAKTINVTHELGHLPVKEGKYEKLANLSMNHQFKVELNEKTFQLEALPSKLDGLTILHISDWHFMGTVDKDFFEYVADLLSANPVDLVCFSGDLIDNMDCVDWIPDTLGKLSGKYGNYFILGNHDWYQEPEVIRDAMHNIGWTDVSSRTRKLSINNVSLQLGGDETPWMGSQPEFDSDSDFRLLLCHTPDNFKDAQRAGVQLMLAGHNHGGQVQLPVIGPVYSPSKYGTLYASGIFWSKPTLMHVSRGLSGRHPFRYRCLPEVTRITLVTKES